METTFANFIRLSNNYFKIEIEKADEGQYWNFTLWSNKKKNRKINNFIQILIFSDRFSLERQWQTRGPQFVKISATWFADQQP